MDKKLREIKFRAWYTGKHSEYSSTDKRRMVEIKNNNLGRLDCNKYIIMQYTGLKDKNGKEIYEGDIVREAPSHNLYTGLEIVKWNDSGYWEPYTVGESCGCCGPSYSWEDVEVVGNIYENPELLGGQNVTG